MMASQAFITFVLNLTYLMETFSDLILIMAIFSDWLTKCLKVKAFVSHRLSQAGSSTPPCLLCFCTPTIVCLGPYYCAHKLYFNYSFTHLSSLLDKVLLKEKGFVSLLNASVLNVMLGTQKKVSKYQLR